MKRFFWKRALALLCALCALGLTGACGEAKNRQGDNGLSGREQANGKLFPAGTEISIMVGSHASWPYNENWVMWKLFREKTGADLQVQAIPLEDLGTKINLLMATPSELPDLMFLIGGKTLTDQHGPDGAFISISEHLDQMAHYRRFWNSVPDAVRENAMMQRVAGDGQIYFPPNYGNETVGNMRAWLYRKDVFEKHGLQPPKDMNELYRCAKRLKELYPESYPISMRSGFSNLDVTGPSWKPYFSPGPYYDYNAGAWRYGTVEPVMREIVEYYAKLVREGLIPPDFLTIAPKSWEELVLSDRGFIMPEYLLRIDYFNIPGRQENPAYTWAVMAPPKANSTQGQSRIARLNYELAGYAVCNTGKPERIDNALKLLDWLYSDEGCAFEGWGEEGVTYQIVNGKKQFLVGEGEVVNVKFGIGTPGLYQRVDPEANEALYSEEQGSQGAFAASFQEEMSNPFTFMAFSEDVADRRIDLYTALETYSQEMLSKFILGQEPMSRWDSFQQELRKIGVDELMEMYEAMYRRMLDGAGMQWEKQ